MFQNFEKTDEQYLSGWKDVRIALERVEKMRLAGQDARVEIINSLANTTLRITLRSTKELDEYFHSHLRRLIIDGLIEDSSCVSGRIVLP
ncbi:MAG: hypothetical protein OEV85_12300 [Candidatus Thorarchaeota archaeon]|nr:hypothetical protein [Candidatus Thorarchaeota archaeon]